MQNTELNYFSHLLVKAKIKCCWGFRGESRLTQPRTLGLNWVLTEKEQLLHWNKCVEMKPSQVLLVFVVLMLSLWCWSKHLVYASFIYINSRLCTTNLYIYLSVWCLLLMHFCSSFLFLWCLFFLFNNSNKLIFHFISPWACLHSLYLSIFADFATLHS